MLMRLEKWVPVKNVSDREQRLIDYQLPGGELVFAPGEETRIHSVVWARNWRRTWLRRITPVIPPSEPDPSVLTMQDLRGLAKEMGISVPVGTKKAEAVEMIAAAKAKEASNAT